MRFGNFVVVKHNGKIVCGKVGDQGIYLKQMGDANPIPFREVEPLFEIEVHRPFPEYFKVDDFRKFVISTLTDADPVKGPHPAITHCEGCGCDWLDNGLNPVGCPYCKQSAETEALRAEVERLNRYYKNGIDCFANPCEGHSGERTPPFSEFFEKYGGQCLICVVDNNKALQAENERLAEALAGLITWIPSADTYRRLGFDPEAPMRVLEDARAALAQSEYHGRNPKSREE